jgi:hypothetical protein
MLPLAALSPNGLLLLALVAIIGLVVLVAKFKCNAFVALMLASVFVGVGSGMPLPNIAKSFQEGVGNTLGFLAMIIGLGTILGKLLAESGAAEVISSTMVRLLGIKRPRLRCDARGFPRRHLRLLWRRHRAARPDRFMLARKTGTPILYLACL